jgi:hypothetical protein
LMLQLISIYFTQKCSTKIFLNDDNIWNEPSKKSNQRSLIWCVDPKGRGAWAMWLGEATINFWGIGSKEIVGERCRWGICLGGWE